MSWWAVAALGVVGVLLRFALTLAMPAVSALSWVVLTVNIVGSFAAGWIYSVKVLPTGVSTPLVTGLLIGLLGGLTTFSSFALDTVRLMLAEQWMLAIANVFMNNLLSIGACFLGWKWALSSSTPI